MFPHVSCWSTLRTALAFTIAGSLLLGSTLWSVHVGAQSQERRVGKPRREKPEGELPDLEEVQRESQLEREAPAAIPSTMRSAKVPLEPWNGRRVGEPEPQIKRETNFLVYAQNGDKRCEVAFHIVGSYSNGRWTARIGRGLLRQ